MTISVIIPVYKVEKFVRCCIESVIAQECTDFNIECLIVDDCSPDGSMSIVHDVIDRYKGTCISSMLFVMRRTWACLRPEIVELLQL